MSVNENATDNIEETVSAWDWDAVRDCIDCNWYDDTSQPDTFMMPFGDEEFICHLCAEEREGDN